MAVALLLAADLPVVSNAAVLPAVESPPAQRSVGPLLDPIAPQRVGAEEHRLLPALRGLGAMADMWFAEAVNLQEGAGGIALFDPDRNSAHGLSWTQMHVRLGALSIVDPARPGQALFDVPYDAWETFSLQALWSDQPGFTWDVSPRAQASTEARAWVRGGGAVDGGAWVPRGLFDRDPAFATGAPTQRRALTQAWEGAVQGTYATPWGPVRLHVEEIAHEHQYLTLAPRDPAQRQTALLTSSLRLDDWDTHVTLGWQRRTRSHEGAQYRLARGADSGRARAGGGGAGRGHAGGHGRRAAAPGPGRRLAAGPAAAARHSTYGLGGRLDVDRTSRFGRRPGTLARGRAGGDGLGLGPARRAARRLCQLGGQAARHGALAGHPGGQPSARPPGTLAPRASGGATCVAT